MSNDPTVFVPRTLTESGASNLLLVSSLLVGPSLFLANQSVNYLLVYWACKNGRLYMLHLVALVCIAITAAIGIAVARHWRRPAPSVSGHATGHLDRKRFMAAVGALISLLSILGMLAMDLPNFFIDPFLR